jgi:cytochrome c553
MTMVSKQMSAGSRVGGAFGRAARWTFVAVLAALPGLALAQAAAPAGNAERGAKLAYTCYGCHGIVDYRNAYPTYHVPKIGGQHEGYIVAALTEYRNGARPHPTMVSQAGSMTDQDIRDIAAYFATREPVKSDGQPTGTAPAAAQVCTACHGNDGVGILPEYPTLSGQHRDYLEHALLAYRRGTRKNAIMQGFAAQLKDEDIRALAAYFSQQQPALWTPRPPRAPAASR